MLVLHPVEDGSGDDGSGHEAVLYIRPLAGRDTEEFFSDSRYGEFWVGARPTLEDIETLTGVRTAHVDDLRDALAKDVGEDGVQLRVVPDVDEAIEAVVEEIRATEAGGRARRGARRGALRAAAGQGRVRGRADAAGRRDDDRRLREDRPRAARRRSRTSAASASSRGRSSGTPARRATPSATRRSPPPASTRRRCTGPTTTARCAQGELVLIDAGVEVDSLYTADITRTLPVDGTFTEVQRRVYQAVLDAADAGFAAAVPGRQVPRRARRGDEGHRRAPRRVGPAAGVRRGGAAAGEPAPPPLDGARHQPPPGPRRARLRAGPGRAVPRRRARAGHGVHHRAGPLLQVRRPAGARRSTAASGCASRTTCSSPPTATRTSRPRCPRDPDAVEAWMAGLLRRGSRTGAAVARHPCAGTIPVPRAPGGAHGRPARSAVLEGRDAAREPQRAARRAGRRARADAAASAGTARVRAPGGGAGCPLGGAGGAGGSSRPGGASRRPRAAAGGYAADGPDGAVVVTAAGAGCAGQPDCTPPISRSRLRALFACSARHSTRVRRRDDLAGRGEVAAPPRERVRDHREQHAERAADEDRRARSGCRTRRDENRREQEPDEQPEPRPVRNPPSAARG